MISSCLYQRDIITISEFSQTEIDRILATALILKKKPRPTLLQNKIIANCFFEPSTRTRLSFSSAAYRLGAQVIGFSDSKNTSSSKGETLSDSMHIIGNYADAIVIRHHLEGAAKLAALSTDKPVINAGDGANQHPTQTLVDLYSILECQGAISGINIAVVGDLKHSRTVHSLAQACSLYKIRFFFISPETLMIPQTICDQLRQKGIVYSHHRSIEEVIDRVDILYMTRLQKERFAHDESFDFASQCKLTPAMLSGAKSNLRILHPLPRVDEIPVTIDQSAHAYYFQQAANGLFVRQAILALLLTEDEIS
jgi:aspartate carbamoyltransferase catalytic subunit